MVRSGARLLHGGTSMKPTSRSTAAGATISLRFPQCQPVAQPAEHNECDDVARQRRTIEGTVAAFIELPAAVPVPEPTIASRS